MRAVVPVYDENGHYVIGCSGRTIYDWEPKWRHSKDFPSDSSLYNYWFAKEFIKKTKRVILVESPGNVWRLEEAGVHNSVALYGGNLSTTKQLLLDKLGVCDIIVATDNDEAGREHAEKIISECSRFYNITTLKFDDKNDIADMTVDEIKSLTKDLI